MSSVFGGLSRNQRKAQRRHEKLLGDAIEKRERLLDEQKFSVESGLGRTAILYSTARLPISGSTEEYLRTNSAYINEANDLADKLGRDKSSVQLAVPRIIKSVISNPEYSDIILIGHGRIDNIFLPGGVYFNWADVSLATKHLKTGKFVQRVCGGFRTDGRSVPMGTFAVEDLSNVEAPVGVPIDDINPEEELIRPVFDNSTKLRMQIDTLNKLYGMPLTEK